MRCLYKQPHRDQPTFAPIAMLDNIYSSEYLIRLAEMRVIASVHISPSQKWILPFFLSFDKVKPQINKTRHSVVFSTDLTKVN